MSIYWQKAQGTSLKKLTQMGRIGLVTDMDGTISHIMQKPEEAIITLRSYELLKALRKKLTLVAVVSRRSVENVRKRIGLSEVAYVSIHGLECCVDGEVRHNAVLDAYLPHLEASVAKLKQISLSGTPPA